MKSRILGLGAAVLASGLFLLSGTASARSTAPTTPGECQVTSLPAFTAQGEGVLEATVADVIEVNCDPTVYGTNQKMKITAAQLYGACGGKLTWYIPNPFKAVPNVIGVTVSLDADGNATVALRAGPGCEAGEGMITAHMESSPFNSFATAFSVLPPNTTPKGVYALPPTQVENGFSSSVATIFQAEFPGNAEKTVRFGSEELFHRCILPPHLRYVLEDGAVQEEEGETEELGVIRGLAPVVLDPSEVKGVRLDDDGNAFVIAIGDASCAEGPSMIEADLEQKPFSTALTTFTIEAPRPVPVVKKGE